MENNIVQWRIEKGRKVGATCKGSSIVLFIFDFIGAIVLGNNFSIRGRYSWESHFNWAIFFYGIIVSFLFCLFLYSVGEIIDQLALSNESLFKMQQKNNIFNEENKDSEPLFTE